MKVKELVEEATEELTTAREEEAIKKIKYSLENIKSCEEELERLNKVHKELLDLDISTMKIPDTSSNSTTTTGSQYLRASNGSNAVWVR